MKKAFNNVPYKHIKTGRVFKFDKVINVTTNVLDPQAERVDKVRMEAMGNHRTYAFSVEEFDLDFFPLKLAIGMEVNVVDDDAIVEPLKVVDYDDSGLAVLSNGMVVYPNVRSWGKVVVFSNPGHYYEGKTLTTVNINPIARRILRFHTEIADRLKALAERVEVLDIWQPIDMSYESILDFVENVEYTLLGVLGMKNEKDEKDEKNS